MKSVRGIYYDLTESNYTFIYDDLKFYFSSNFYLQNFIKKHLEYLKKETIKLQIKYNCMVSADYMLLINLYKQIEKRGFLVYYKNKHLSDKYFIDLILINNSLDLNVSGK